MSMPPNAPHEGRYSGDRDRNSKWDARYDDATRWRVQELIGSWDAGDVVAEAEKILTDSGPAKPKQLRAGDPGEP